MDSMQSAVRIPLEYLETARLLRSVFLVKYDRGSKGTHQDVNDREDNDSIVAAPVGVCKEGSQQREDVDSAGPIGHLLHC